MPTNFTQQLRTAAEYLSSHDPVLAPIVTQHGLPNFEPHHDYYGALVNSIIGQQLSVKSAAAIKQRFRDLYGGALPSPDQILATSPDQLRALGFSYAKANYVRDLAEHVKDGRIKFDQITNQTNDEIIAELTSVKGIGEWTVHMFLIFCVGRLDILATGDLGVRNAIRNLYGFEHAPTPAQVIETSESNHWAPYQSAVCWYLWRSLDNAPN